MTFIFSNRYYGFNVSKALFLKVALFDIKKEQFSDIENVSPFFA